MKVVGRDVWIGIWAFVMALIATTCWERRPGSKTNLAEIWWRFQKFVIGFLLASIIVTLIATQYGEAEFKKTVIPAMVGPINDLRTWSSIFCFFSIGMTTRFRELASAGMKPFLAFTSGIVVNVILGFILSTMIFVEYWYNLSH
jgi:uncharacterized membrane protein YadS